MEKLVTVRKEYHKDTQENIGRAQAKQKEYYDAKHDTHHVIITCNNYC